MRESDVVCVTLDENALRVLMSMHAFFVRQAAIWALNPTTAGFGRAPTVFCALCRHEMHKRKSGGFLETFINRTSTHVAHRQRVVMRMWARGKQFYGLELCPLTAHDKHTQRRRKFAGTASGDPGQRGRKQL